MASGDAAGGTCSSSELFQIILTSFWKKLFMPHNFSEKSIHAFSWREENWRAQKAKEISYGATAGNWKSWEIKAITSFFMAVNFCTSKTGSVKKKKKGSLSSFL